MQRAVRIASLSDAAKAEAKALGLDNNQSALLEAAKEKTPEKQVENRNGKGRVSARPRCFTLPVHPRSKEACAREYDGRLWITQGRAGWSDQ